MSWRLHRDADLAPIGAVWRAAEAAGAYSVFQTYRFALHWADCFAEETEFWIRWQESPPAVIPLVRYKQRWSLLGEGLFDYQHPVGELSPDAQREAAAWLNSRVGAPARMTGVPAATPWQAFWCSIGLAPHPFAAVPLRLSGEDSLAQEHARVERRWHAAGVELIRVSEPHQRSRALAWLLERKAEALAAKGACNVLGGAECRWMAQMVEREPALAELWQLVRGHQVLAGLLCWVTPPMRYAYTIAYDQVAAALSPGILALYALLRHTMREGRGFNFLTGEQAFKQRFATTRENLLRYVTHNA